MTVRSYRLGLVRGGLVLAMLLPAILARGGSEDSGVADLAAIKQAARLGHPRSQFKLGDYYTGRRDYTNAVHWYRKSAELGNAEAQLTLSSFYRVGRGVAQDWSEADRWARLGTAPRSGGGLGGEGTHGSVELPIAPPPVGGDGQEKRRMGTRRVAMLQAPSPRLDYPEAKVRAYVMPAMPQRRVGRLAARDTAD